MGKAFQVGELNEKGPEEGRGSVSLNLLPRSRAGVPGGVTPHGDFQATEGAGLYSLGNVGFQASKGLDQIHALYNGHSGYCMGEGPCARQGWMKADQLGAHHKVGDDGEGVGHEMEGKWLDSK